MTIHSRHSFETHTTGFTDWTNSQNLVNRKTDHLLNPIANLGFLSSAPLSASNGDGYVDSSSYYVYDGGAWYQYAGIEAGTVLDTLSNIIWVWNGSTYINFGALILSSVTTLPPSAIYNGMIANPALFFANTLASISSASPNISVSPQGLAAWWANTVSTQLVNASLAEARTGTNSTKIINPDDLKAVFHFGSGSGAPSGAPSSQSEGFYHDILTNSYHVYDYVSASWKNLTDNNNAYSSGSVLPSSPSHGYIFHNTSSSSLSGIPANGFGIYNSTTTSWDTIERANFSASLIAPSSPMVFDLWQNTDSVAVSGVNPSALAYWNGSSWVTVSEPSASIYTQTTAPASPKLYDIWKNSSATSVSGVGSGNLAYWNGSAWIDFFGDSVFLRVSSNIAQTIVGALATAVKSFNIVESDNFGGWSIAMNHYVVPEDGVYQISSGLFCICDFSASVTSGVNIFIQVNGVISTSLNGGVAFASTAPLSGLGVTTGGSVAIRLLAGQTVRILCENGSGLSQSQSTALSRSNYLTIIKIGEL